MWKKSLKVRLTLYVVLPVMVALVTIGGIGFYSAYNEAQDIYDAELSNVAKLMLSLLRAEDEEEARHVHPDNEDEINSDIVELGTDFEEAGGRYDRKLAFRIWKGDRLLFYSKKAQDFGKRRVTAGFSDQDLDGSDWRMYVLPDRQSGYTIEIAQKFKVREHLIKRILTTIFSPLALLLPIVLVLVWAGLRIGLKPLLSVSDAVRRRSAMDLTPIPSCESLVEIAPLINAINDLLGNLDYTLKKERRFTDFAAHELRTPIAIFKTQAQTALKATDDAQRRQILQAQVLAADRATAMVDQLLTLARLEHSDIPTSELQLAGLARDVVGERMPLAEQKSLTLQLDAKASPTLHGNREILTIILSNLVDNAIKYTQPQGKVTVTITQEHGSAVITVSDTGPGIPEDQLPFCTERFYRGPSQQTPGAGLGLAIVKRASELMNADLLLQNRPGGRGFEAVLRFPA